MALREAGKRGKGLVPPGSRATGGADGCLSLPRTQQGSSEGRLTRTGAGSGCPAMSGVRPLVTGEAWGHLGGLRQWLFTSGYGSSVLFFLPVLPDTRMHTSGLGRLAEPLRPKQGYASPFSLGGEL